MNIISYDISKIHKEIAIYKALHLNKSPYIICSEDTLRLILSIIDPEKIYIYAKDNTVVRTFIGCKVLEDNSLNLGEIEIR